MTLSFFPVSLWRNIHFLLTCYHLFFFTLTLEQDNNILRKIKEDCLTAYTCVLNRADVDTVFKKVLDGSSAIALDGAAESTKEIATSNLV